MHSAANDAPTFFATFRLVLFFSTSAFSLTEYEWELSAKLTSPLRQNDVVFDLFELVVGGRYGIEKRMVWSTRITAIHLKACLFDITLFSPPLSSPHVKKL